MSPRFVINALSNAIIQSNAKSLTTMDVLLALKDAIESDARIDAKKKRKWVDFLVVRAQGLLQPLGQGGRAQGAVRLLRAGGAGAARQVPRRGRGDARQPQAQDPITSEEREPDERFLRAVEEKIRISDSGKQSFRQEVVRKAMGAYKRGDKFTLDSHAPLHDAVEQYLFEQRRDVLRLVSSTTRPEEETRAEDLGGREAAGRRVRLRRAQRARGAELRDDAAGAGIAAKAERPDACAHRSTDPRADGCLTPCRHDLIIRAARPPGTSCSRAARATGCGTTRRCARRCKDQLPDLLAGGDFITQPDQRTCGAGAAARARALPPRRPAEAAGRRPGQGEPGDMLRPGARAERRATEGEGGTATAASSFCSSSRSTTSSTGCSEELKLPDLRPKRRDARTSRVRARRLGQARRALAPRPPPHGEAGGEAPRDPDRRGPEFGTSACSSRNAARRALLFAELPIDSSQIHVRPMVGGHVDLQGACQCAAIVTPAVGIAKGDIVIPARMMRVELHRSFHYAQAVFPVTGISDHVSEYCCGGGIHAIQGERALRCRAEGQVVFLEEQGGSQCAVGEVAGRRRCDCSLRGSTGAA